MEITNTSLLKEKKQEFSDQYLIINADDLGICVERDMGIFELYEKKVISCASIIVNGSSFESAIKKARKLGLPLGIHLNLTEGEPINKTNLESNTLVKYDEKTKNYIMHGKFGFRELLKAKKINYSDIKNELIHQILVFVKAYQILPDHFDGHQHIHIIPEIAEIIADISSNYFSIYYTRIPIENMKFIEKRVYDFNRLNFYKTIMMDSIVSSRIFLENQISFPNKFFGMSIMGKDCTCENLNDILNAIKEESITDKKPYYVEYMCHPGYPSENFWDEFNISKDRLHEKEIIENFFNRNIYNLKPFSSITSNYNSNLNILILGDLTYGTGNSITAKRLKEIFNGLGNNTYLFNVKYLNTFENTKDLDIASLFNFILSKKIHLIVGINLWRAGRIIHLLKKKTENEIFIDLKYLIILSGTDANVFINEEDKIDIMKNVLQESEYVISFNNEMLDKIKIKIENLQSYFIIPQSISIKNSNYSIRKELNITDTQKITLLPSSIRSVKDPMFIIPTIIEILKERSDHTFVVIGAKFDEKLYEEMKELRDRANLQDRIIIHDAVEHRDFINLLKEVDLVVNSSISEGMSNAIMESMLIGVPILARGNEGNKKLIKHMENGLIYNTAQEFREFYDKIYNDKELRKFISGNSIREIKEKYGYESEVEKYEKILEDFKHKYYKKLENPDFGEINLIFSKSVHPFSSENNEIFMNADLQDERYKEINLLDVGCGAGIFSIIFMIKNKNLKIKHLVLCDTDEIALANTFQNLVYNKSFFNFEKLTVIKSNLLKDLPTEYNNYFDIVLANMPQTPSKHRIRSDKHGGLMGIELYCGLFEDLTKFTKTIFKTYILHISLSAPKLLEEKLSSLQLKQTVLFQQKRTLNPIFLDSLCENLSGYFHELKSKEICEYEEIDKENWGYYVWLKEITTYSY